MATPIHTPPSPPTNSALCLCAPEPLDDCQQSPRRPDRDLPPADDLQRWLDLSG